MLRNGQKVHSKRTLTLALLYLSNMHNFLPIIGSVFLFSKGYKLKGN